MMSPAQKVLLNLGRIALSRYRAFQAMPAKPREIGDRRGADQAHAHADAMRMIARYEALRFDLFPSRRRGMLVLDLVALALGLDVESWFTVAGCRS